MCNKKGVKFEYIFLKDSYICTSVAVLVLARKNQSKIQYTASLQSCAKKYRKIGLYVVKLPQEK